MNKIFLIPLLILLTSCGAYFNQPTQPLQARLGETSEITSKLSDFPEPQQEVVVGVYNFRDQTGQFKATDNGSTFSTAVSQGATSILLKALEDSNWFIPLERENINNLLNERNIIETTRNQFANRNGTKAQPLKPLLFAGILLEGGIVSYDTNILTGGVGARYFGVGGSSQYRQDRVTVYLRAVSTSNGEILKTVYVSKTILSQAIDASFFRFVKFQRLLEAETGFTKNEPVQLAVTEAIEKSVETLILEGVKDGLWQPKKEGLAKMDSLLASYESEKAVALDTELYDRFQKDRRGKDVLSLNSGVALMDGDFANAKPGILGSLQYKRYISPFLNLNGSSNFFRLENDNVFKQDFTSLDLNMEFTILPYDKMSPFIYAGAGLNYDFKSKLDSKIQYGIGLEFFVDDRLGVSLFAEHNIALNDELDNFISRKRDDHFYKFGIGLNIYLSKPKSDVEIKKSVERKRIRKKKQQSRLNQKIGSRIAKKLQIANEEIKKNAIKDSNKNE